MLDRPRRVGQKPVWHNDFEELATSSSSSGEGMNLNPQPSNTFAQSMDTLRSALGVLRNNTTGTQSEQNYLSGTDPPISGMPQELESFQELEGTATNGQLQLPPQTEAEGQELQVMETEQQKIARLRQEELAQLMEAERQKEAERQQAHQEAARRQQAQREQQEEAMRQQAQREQQEEAMRQQAQLEEARRQQAQLEEARRQQARREQEEEARHQRVQRDQEEEVRRQQAQRDQEEEVRRQQAQREQEEETRRRQQERHQQLEEVARQRRPIDDIEANLERLHGDGIPPAHENNDDNIDILNAAARRIPGNIIGDVPNGQNINNALLIQLLQSIRDAQRDHHQYCVNQFRHINNRIDRIGGLIEREPQFPTKPDALPMRTRQNIEEFETASDEVFKQVVDYLTDLGGFNLHETANFMVKNAIEDSLSPSLTWQGREPGTLKLQDTKIAKAFHAAASKNKAFGKPTVKEFTDAMTSALKSSKQRNRNRQRGGGNRRQREDDPADINEVLPADRRRRGADGNGQGG